MQSPKVATGLITRQVNYQTVEVLTWQERSSIDRLVHDMIESDVRQVFV